MPTVDKSSFTIEDIKELIKLSSSCGVTLLKLSDLHIEFGKPPEPMVQESISTVEPFAVFTNSRPEEVISDTQEEPMTEDAHLQEEMRQKDEQIAMMLIEDPQLAEQLIMDGDLEDDSTDTNDEFRD